MFDPNDPLYKIMQASDNAAGGYKRAHFKRLGCLLLIVLVILVIIYLKVS